MLKSEHLMTLSGVVRDGVLWAIDTRSPQAVFPVTGPHGMDDFANLRNSSLIMFHTLTNLQEGLDRISVLFEALAGEGMQDAEKAVESVMRMQAAVNVTRRCAIEGVENIAAQRT